MKKLSFFILACLCALSLNAKKLYLNTGGSSVWGADAPAFFAHTWGASDSDVQLINVSGDIFAADIPDGNSSVVFVRMPSGSTALDWDKKWNQSDDLTIPADKNMYKMTSWGEGGKVNGTWAVYDASDPGGGGGGTDCQDGPYALYINGVSVGTFVDGGMALDGVTPQLNISARIKAGDKVEFCNTSCDQFFFPQNIETGGDVDGSGNFTIAAASATCSVDGCYNFWWKKVYGADALYIGTDGTCPTPYDPTKKYYIAGNGTEGSAWCCGVAWEPNGCELVDNKVSYTNLPMGNYQFKITDGTWVSPYGYTSVNAECSTSNILGDGDGNVTFVIYKQANVEITFDGTICVKVTGDDTPDVPVRPDYEKSVPTECADVMLQAFYYDSYKSDDDAHPAPGNVDINGKKLGNTRWSTLLEKSNDIGMYFDLVWLPPSGKSTGTGYHQKQYSNQNSDWGSKMELLEFINRMHANNTKVVADIVINHAEGPSWCTFETQNFTPYGVFNPDASWICKTDELNDAGRCDDPDCLGKATGVDDGGYNGQDNYGSARDWAHADVRVQNMMKAYLKWMKNVMGFDGWRYDYAQGFKGKYIDMYNSASKNYFSVCEFWNENVKGYLGDCNWNTTVFDFGNKYNAINAGIADGNYGKCMGSGLQGTGDGRHAVTFVDSHDTYFGCYEGRTDQSEIGGCGKSMENYNKDRVLGANAYILSRPGIPCVFWPHWVKYQKEINQMIMARQITGVHSESTSDEEAGDGYYKTTVYGKKGSIRLLLGPNSGYGSTPAGYQLAYRGGNFAMYYQTSESETPRLSITPSQKYKTSTFSVTMEAAALSGTPAIYYTTDGTTPSASSTKYSDAFTVTGTTTVKAIAILNGKSSAVMEATYTYKAPQTTPIIVRFRKDATWGDVDAVYIHTWGTGTSTGAWPGLKLTEGSDGWYTYQFPAAATKPGFVFNNGDKGVKTGDLTTDCDVCYIWQYGSETIDEDCSQAEIGLSLLLSPTSTTFRDKSAGINVTITAVGVPEGQKPTIYYTTNGTNPTTSSTSSTTNPLTLNFKETTELRAMAVAGGKTTDIVKGTYTYKEPQDGPIMVSFKAPDSWSQVNLYAWTTDGTDTELLGGWPGTKMNIKSQGAYIYTFDKKHKSVNVIFNNGTDQTGDLLVEESTCFEWAKEEVNSVRIIACPGQGIDNVDADVPQLDLRAPMFNVLGQRVDASYRGIIIQNGHKYLMY